MFSACLGYRVILRLVYAMQEDLVLKKNEKSKRRIGEGGQGWSSFLEFQKFLVQFPAWE